MDNQLFVKLHAAGIISDSSLDKINSSKNITPLSVFWELKTILYLGVMLFTSGAGILIYKNIDTIGHSFIVLFIAIVSFSSFTYCFKKSKGFSFQKINSPNIYFDYVLLLACLTFTSLIAYLQFEYQFFGLKYGLALFIPMVILFVAAYYFDNLAILSLAITNLGAWAGIAVTPLQILHSNNFNKDTIIFTGLALGLFLLILGFISNKKNLKAHFEFTYINFGAHLMFISCLAAMVVFAEYNLLWMLALVFVSFIFYKKALKQKSFYFILIMTVYFYIGFTNLIFHLLFYQSNYDNDLLSLSFLYFILTAFGLIIFLSKTNKKLKQHDSI